MPRRALFPALLTLTLTGGASVALATLPAGAAQPGTPEKCQAQSFAAQGPGAECPRVPNRPAPAPATVPATGHDTCHTAAAGDAGAKGNGGTDVIGWPGEGCTGDHKGS